MIHESGLCEVIYVQGTLAWRRTLCHIGLPTIKKYACIGIYGQ